MKQYLPLEHLDTFSFEGVFCFIWDSKTFGVPFSYPKLPLYLLILQNLLHHSEAHSAVSQTRMSDTTGNHNINLRHIILRLTLLSPPTTFIPLDFTSHLSSLDHLLLNHPCLSSITVHFRITTDLNIPDAYARLDGRPAGVGLRVDDEVGDDILPYLDGYIRRALAGLDFQGRLDLSIVRDNAERKQLRKNAYEEGTMWMNKFI
jgi:hypothetical protein